MIRSFADRDTRICYFRNTRNLGAGGNFNRVFRLSCGTYFKWCAHDDLISGNFLTDTVNALDEDTDAVIAYPTLLGIDRYGAITAYQERDLPDMSNLESASRFRILMAAHGCDAAMFGLWRRSSLALTSLHEPYYGSDCALLAEMALLGKFVRVPSATLFSRDHPTRSVNLHSSERLLWHNQDASGSNPFELSNRFRHLVVIAYRHRRQAPVHRSLCHLVFWMLDPPLIGRLVLEGVGAFSPALRARLRAIGLRALKSIQGSSNQPSGRT